MIKASDRDDGVSAKSSKKAPKFESCLRETAIDQFDSHQISFLAVPKSTALQVCTGADVRLTFADLMLNKLIQAHVLPHCQTEIAEPRQRELITKLALLWLDHVRRFHDYDLAAGYAARKQIYKQMEAALAASLKAMGHFSAETTSGFNRDFPRVSSDLFYVRTPRLLRDLAAFTIRNAANDAEQTAGNELNFAACEFEGAFNSCDAPTAQHFMDSFTQLYRQAPPPPVSTRDFVHHVWMIWILLRTMIDSRTQTGPLPQVAREETTSALLDMFAEATGLPLTNNRREGVLYNAYKLSAPANFVFRALRLFERRLSPPVERRLSRSKVGGFVEKVLDKRREKSTV